MLDRRLALSLAAALLFFSGAAIIFDTWFSNDPDVERFLCRYTLICANDLALDSATIELWNPDSNRLTTLASFRESLRRNPHSAARWCDLGDAYLHVGEPQRATYCINRRLTGPPGPLPSCCAPATSTTPLRTPAARSNISQGSLNCPEPTTRRSSANTSAWARR